LIKEDREGDLEDLAVMMCFFQGITGMWDTMRIFMTIQGMNVFPWNENDSQYSQEGDRNISFPGFPHPLFFLIFDYHQ
jgi:hypothetical protein